MRLWSLHPQYLDPQGLVALWREALLAQAVLRGQTRGYTRHPQLQRFQQLTDPVSGLAQYLQDVHAEATRRGYRFDASKIAPVQTPATLAVARGQMDYEWAHLLAKLEVRNPALHQRWAPLAEPEAHPMFRQEDGPMAEWERPLGR